jgi:hypothetical protein
MYSLKNPCCQLLNVRCVNDIRQTERHTAQPPAPEHGTTGAEMVTEKWKVISNPVLIKLQQNCFMIETERFVLRSMNLLILFARRKNCLRRRRIQPLYQFVRRAIKHIIAIIKAYHCYHLHTKFYPTIFLKVKSICNINNF